MASTLHHPKQVQLIRTRREIWIAQPDNKLLFQSSTGASAGAIQRDSAAGLYGASQLFPKP